MEDTLSVYHRQQDAKRPVVCFDEGSKQLTKETRLPLPPRPGAVAKYDYEYERNGASNLFLCFAPLQAWRHVKVTARRTMVDFAHCMRDLVDIHFPQADTIVVVMDNLNTHKLASLYEAFPPAEARRLAAKLEIHYTPKHGSWLNMAEIELSVLHRQCLNARIPDKHILTQQITAWQNRRNASASSVNWRFTTADARIKLERLYPTIEDCWTTSVDTKNRQLVGNFANQGRCWRQAPEQVNVHDFPGDALGRAVPYAIDDIVHNQGYVYLGNSYDTPEFAAHAIAQWWTDPERPRFQREDKLLLLCDAGGSNNCRSWLWKLALQRQFVDRFGIPVVVCHYPTGASKYNPIAYRLFSQITCNGAGQPLRSFDIMLNDIRSTTTTTGLTVKAFLVDRAFQKGRKASLNERLTIHLTRPPICPTWNDMIEPTPLS